MTAIAHLYVHIPFCPKVCPYCSFYKEAESTSRTRAFLDAVLLELSRAQEQHRVRPRTIFFGGGTPSALSPSQLEYLLSGLSARLDLSLLEEWTLEMNPATVSLEKANLLRLLGVNRISMGVQSWEPRLLDILGRVHSADQARRSYEILREAGFTNVNLDHIFGVPTQTPGEWESTLATTIALKPEHISAYNLTYEQDTEYFKRFERGEYQQDDQEDAELFETTMTTLEQSGYEQYEISNYSLPGRECLHNLAYWDGADYLGLGPSAFSTIGGTRHENIRDTREYIRRIEAGESAAEFTEPTPAELRNAESIAFGLRTNRGVTKARLQPWESDVLEFERLGLLESRGDRWILSRKGRLLADSVAEAFV